MLPPARNVNRISVACPPNQSEAVLPADCIAWGTTRLRWIAIPTMRSSAAESFRERSLAARAVTLHCCGI
jgi:hypothetical protein